ARGGRFAPKTAVGRCVSHSAGRIRGRNASRNASRSSARIGASGLMEISQLLEEIDWIPRPKILALRRLGIETVEDLLTHFPRRHEDRHQFSEFPRDESDKPIC